MGSFYTIAAQYNSKSVKVHFLDNKVSKSGYCDFCYINDQDKKNSIYLFFYGCFLFNFFCLYFFFAGVVTFKKTA
jgi:hypothetical protein